MFRRTKQGALSVIEAGAPLLRDSCADFNAVVETCLEEGTGQVVVDMREVSLIDSAGLEALVDLQDRCLRQGGVLKLGGLTRLCEDIFRVTGLEEQIEIFPDVIVAMGSFAE